MELWDLASPKSVGQFVYLKVRAKTVVVKWNFFFR